MDCTSALEALSAALDGELDDALLAQLDEHLSQCPRCRALQQELLGIRDACGGLEAVPPPELKERVMANLPPRQKAKPPILLYWKRWAAMAAVFVLVAAAVWQLPQFFPASPQNIEFTGRSVAAGGVSSTPIPEIAGDPDALPPYVNGPAVSANSTPSGSVPAPADTPSYAPYSAPASTAMAASPVPEPLPDGDVSVQMPETAPQPFAVSQPPEDTVQFDPEDALDTGPFDNLQVSLFASTSPSSKTLPKVPAVVEDTAPLDAPSSNSPIPGERKRVETAPDTASGAAVPPVVLPEAVVAVSDPDDPDGAAYVYENDGFGGDFSLRLFSDHTYSYSTGPLSSCIGMGTWTLENDVLTLTESFAEPYMDDAGQIVGSFLRENRFRVEDGALVFEAAPSANFLYVQVADGERFLLRD